jgi:aminoglycoside phosphotransferase family enzyme
MAQLSIRSDMPSMTIQRSTSQDEVLTFLENPATHGGTSVKRVDTHAAYVFLSGYRTLKIKRAIRFLSSTTRH